MRERPYVGPDIDNELNVVVLGGSQGAKVLGETAAGAGGLTKRHSESAQRFSNAAERPPPRRRYSKTPESGEVSSFFDDITARRGRSGYLPGWCVDDR